MIKKRNGSSMVTVLGVTLVLVFLSGIILSLTMGTMKSNTNQKVVEDLRYAAESGLEVGRSRMSEKPIVSGTPGNEVVTFPSIDTRTSPDDVLVQSLKKGMIGNVEVVSTTTDADKFITITSVATHKDDPSKKAEVKCVYRKNKNSAGSVLDYGLVAGSGPINIEYIGDPGNVMLNDSHVSKPEGEKVIINGVEYNGRNPGKPVGNATTDNNLSNNLFGDLKMINMDKASTIVGKADIDTQITSYENFKFYDRDGTGANRIEETLIEINNTDTISYKYKNEAKVDIKVDELKNKPKTPIVKIKIKYSGAHPRDFIILNCDNLEFKFGKGDVNLTNTVILSSGKVRLTGERGGMKLTAGTIYGTSVNIDDSVGAVHFAFETAGGSGHGVSEAQETHLNNVINKIIENWNQVSGLEKDYISMESGSFES